MARALWIGGPPGSGKTTLAGRLARRHGLRLYSSDTRTWAHVDRGLAVGSEAARLWHELPPGVRWDAPHHELVARAFHRERAPMVADDVAGLPPAPLVVAEGTVISPRLVDREHALWLLPAERAGSGALYDALAEEIERDALETGVPVLRPGTIEQTLAAAEEHFAPTLVEGPRAETPDERRALLREANEAIVEQVHGYFARPWTEGDADGVERTFLCECGDTICTSNVVAAVGLAASGPLLARGHQ